MKKIFLFIVSGILIVAIPVTVYLVGKNQETRKRAAPATTLTLSPAQATENVNDTFPLEVKIDTADNQVARVQIQLTFDPSKIQAINITNGALAPTIRVSGKVDPTGKASITVGAQDETHPITGVGTVAVVTMKALAPSTTPVAIQFSPAPDTFINALGEATNNVLIGSTGAIITIQGMGGGLGETANVANTPIPTPTGNQNASQSAQMLQITSPTNNEQITNALPSFAGTASPSATVTLTIQSTPQTVVVTADGNGNWTYTPTTPLDVGQHSVTALTTDPTTGASQTTTASFVVAAASDTTQPSSQSATAATGSAIPQTGSVSTTIIVLAIGFLMFLGGAMLPAFTR